MPVHTLKKPGSQWLTIDPKPTVVSGGFGGKGTCKRFLAFADDMISRLIDNASLCLRYFCYHCRCYHCRC